MNTEKFSFLREACAQINITLGRSGLVDITFGNVSVFSHEDNVFAIKPSGVPYENLTKEDIVVMDLLGNRVWGAKKPSSDEPTHRFLYQHFEDKPGAIIHTHSRNAVAFAQAGQEIPCLGTTHADHFNGPIPITEWMSDADIHDEYEWNTGESILHCFKQKKISPKEIPAVLVKGHGPFVWGPTPQKAFENAIALEVCAEMALKTLSLNPSVKPLPSRYLNKHYNRKHGRKAYYGQ